jgi:hypothetical protein
VTSYDDGRTRLDADGILLRRYYFPLGRPKRLAWTDVRGARAERLGAFNGRWRLWGYGANAIPATWLGLDLRRHRRTTKVIVDLGRRIKPAFTPLGPPGALAVLRGHINVEETPCTSDRQPPRTARSRKHAG